MRTVRSRLLSIFTRRETVTWLMLLPIVFNFALISSSGWQDPIKKTNSGRVRGRRHFVNVDGNQRAVDVFLGIPYARPPVGYLRFQHPQPAERWNGVLDASTAPRSCYQVPDTQFGDFPGATVWNSPTPVSEDCLYLNVFVPRSKASSPQKLPVMVWIYGGGFYSGTISLGLYDGRILACHGTVVIVSIGYRLGALGFLALNHPTAPGNAGLFDQLMGLEWVQSNIRQFGGDPDNVTLFGESAGSVSVSLHLLSPLSHNKFHRAILQSGTANMPWATVSMDEAKQRSERLARNLGCGVSGTPTDEMAACLRARSAENIVREQWVTSGVLQFPFLPVVDGIFISDPPTELLHRGCFKKCPILIGTNANEGSNFVMYELHLRTLLELNRKSMTRSQYMTSMDELFKWYPQYPTRLNRRAIEAIALQYMSSHHVITGDDPRSPSSKIKLEAGDDKLLEMNRNLNALDMAVGDSQFVCPLNDFGQAYARAEQTVFSYQFTLRYSSNPWPSWMGVVHGDEIFFVLGEAVRNRNFTENEKNFSRKLMLYWSNFAKTGDPNQCPGKQNLGEWPQQQQQQPDTSKHLELNLNILNSDQDDKKNWIRNGPRTKECAFWRDTLPTLITNTEETKRLAQSSSAAATRPPSSGSDPSRRSSLDVSVRLFLALTAGLGLTQLLGKFRCTPTYQ